MFWFGSKTPNQLFAQLHFEHSKMSEKKEVGDAKENGKGNNLSILE